VLPNDRGARDAQHHKERVHRQIADHVKRNVGKEDVITGGGKIKVPVRGQKQYRFILDRGEDGGAGGPGDGPGGGAGQDAGEEMYEVWLDQTEVEELLFAELDLPRLRPKRDADPDANQYRFDTFARKGPLLDKKATIRRALSRSAQQGKPGLEGLEKDDLRYISYREHPLPKTKAVVFLCMDVSGSMGDHEKRLARLFFFWITRFLRSKYDTFEVKFIAHTTEAHEVTEHQFFNRVESGGTTASSAYQLVKEMQEQRYPEADWNVYVLHASDGDNWQHDNEEVRSLIEDLLKVCALVGYLEIRHPSPGMWGTIMPTIGDHLGEHAAGLGPNFAFALVADDAGIWPAIKEFFGRTDDVESYV
jgi:hypothetical protein